VLLVGLGGVGLAGEAPSGGGAKPAIRPLLSTPAKKPAPEPAQSADLEASAVRRREEAAYWRRLAVCDKLIDIAYQTNDVALEQVAEQLKQRAFDVYVQRVGSLPTGEAGADEERLRQVQENGQPVGGRLEQRPRTVPGQQDARSGRPSGWFRR
jgi:hypothetical protein